ncbi:tRNA (adenosine(37)-N6)-dimethylallyltransferase MiaA [Leucobacter insecticola]|uniref:tRNA dimethylallyltransferase n=1 Tax=Leucobacter insecticola TaxID=2714934 RepID=A0A6G8FKN7_9MICO|nr:tRNA (adenosine(37)-N6)-dimethylallyltransferase MiaA [Leucobacter insecticola]QIM16908.1 tRNA (adenosine(37)-N6)-dimethylallyltransferase MiaA [Leucobacter insecticola]
MPKLWVIVGATGTGKSALSLDLAEALAGRGAEIVNADAMQLYRGMDIGTAKLPASERRGIPHHLFDALAPEEEATVARYQPEARARITEIQDRGKDAILVGGSGLYVSSVIYDFQFPPRDEALRAELEQELAERGGAPLLARLREIAPAVADAVDANNPRRVVRALEVALLGGDAQVVLPSEPQLWQQDTRLIGVRAERAVLVERLDRRVEQMWADGLLDEVRGLIPNGIEHGPTASRAIGYAQALAQLAGQLTEAEAIAETQALTRRYARRQVSWFKRYPGVEWLDAPSLAMIH